MLVPLSWLKHYLAKAPSDAQILAALERSTIEVEGYQAATELDPRIVTAKVETVSDHPQADRLHLAQVSDGQAAYSIVCGAPNLAAGQTVVLAKIGAVLPSGDIIALAKLRGQESQGMLCSPRELGLSDDHAGILVLPEDTPLGISVAKLYPAESVVDIKTPFNRFDVLSMVGVAHEVAALAGVATKITEPVLPAAGKGPALSLAVDPEIVPRFIVAEVALNKLPKEPVCTSWLEAAGVRSLGPVVDVTNFVLLEWGQPLHAYDAAKVKGGLQVRWAKAGETLVTLDEVKRKLTAHDLVIADNDGPVGLAGVMGGLRTAVSAETKRVLLEAATFDAATVRKTAQRQGLRSEASARFERGLPVQLAAAGLARALELLGGTAAITEELRVWPWIQRIGLRRSKLNRLLGTELSFEEAVAALGSLGIAAQHFDIAAEAKRLLGKPYKLGAKFRSDGLDAFDCSYLTDYLYSLIGQPIGHTAHQQSKTGWAVELTELRAGDLLFRGGPWKELDEKEREGVSHNALYVGDGQIIHAIDIERGADDSWQPRTKGGVSQDVLSVMTEDPQYLSARRFVDNIDDWLSVPEVPWWRADLKTEEDLVEEIVRVIGYDRVPAQLPQWRPQAVSFDWRTPRLWRLKDLLSGLGLFEVVTYSLVSADQAAQAAGEKDHLKVANPLSREQAYLRRSLVPSLLAVASNNERYAPSFGLYEISRVFVPESDHAKLPAEPTLLTVVVKGDGEVYSQIKGVLDALDRAWNLPMQVKASKPGKQFLPGRAVEVLLEKQHIGVMGELAQSGVKGRVAALELDLAKVLANTNDTQAVTPSRFPSISRDVNLVVERSVTWAEVEQLVAESGLGRPSFVNDYYPESLASDRKNLTIRLTMTDPERTLTDAEADHRIKTVVALLRKQFGAEPAS